MARTPREKFERERERCRAIDDPEVADALGYQFADALDPEVPHVELPKVNGSLVDGHESKSNSTAGAYLNDLKNLHGRGLDLLGADAGTVNDFMDDLVTEPDDRRFDLVDYDGSLTRQTAAVYQAALRTFYRFCTEPGVKEDRPEVVVSWEDVNGSRRIKMFKDRSAPRHETEGSPVHEDLEALREACLSSQNTRRDRAFLEVAAGTGQRVYALVTLRVRDVRGHIDGNCDCEGTDFSHVLLNPAIKNDGDKGAISRTSRLAPFVADARPVTQWIEKHPLSSAEKRVEVGAAADFEDCYVFVGAPNMASTELDKHWEASGAREMLKRRAADTASIPDVRTVTNPVNPHAWRGYVYTRSKDLNIDEDVRRAALGWTKGSDIGEKLYNSKSADKAVSQFVDAFNETFGEVDAASVAEQIVGSDGVADLAPEDRLALVRELVADDQSKKELRVALGLDDIEASVTRLADLQASLADAGAWDDLAAGRVAPEDVP